MGERSGRRVAVRFERVDTQIKRRPTREGCALLGAFGPKHAAQMPIEPLRVIPQHRSSRTGERAIAQGARFGFCQRLRRETRAIAKLRDRIDIKAARELEHPEHIRARRRITHQVGGGRLASQGVIDEPADRRAVAGTGEAMRHTPIAQRIGCGPVSDVDIRENFDGCGKACGGGHNMISSMRTM